LNSKFTPEIKKKILNYVEAGAKVTSAANQAGVTAPSISNWRKKAKEGEEEYIAFFGKLRAAQAKHELSLVKGMDSLALQYDFKAMTWMQVFTAL